MSSAATLTCILLSIPQFAIGSTDLSCTTAPQTCGRALETNIDAQGDSLSYLQSGKTLTLVSSIAQDQGSSRERRIPRILHQEFSTTTLPKKFARNRQSWVDCLGNEWQLKLWTDEENRELVQSAFPEFLATYDSYDEPIKRIDAIRYVYMYVFGGLYADLDLLCTRNPGGRFDHLPVVLAYSKPWCWMQPAFMASEPGHPFWLKALQGLAKSQDLNVLDATGPMFLTYLFQNYTGTGSNGYADYDVFDQQTFGDITVFGNRHICWDYTSVQAKTCASDYPDSFAIHQHSHTWITEEHNVTQKQQPHISAMPCHPKRGVRFYDGAPKANESLPR